MILYHFLNYCHIWPQKTKRDIATRLQLPQEFPVPEAVYLESPQAAGRNRDLRLWKDERVQIAYSDLEAQTYTIWSLSAQ